MTPSRMHPDEVPTDEGLVRRLLAAQFPHWAGLPVARVPTAGTDNALYRLGSDMVVRLPRIHWAVDDLEKEQRWLPVLAPQLPVAVPTPLAMGGPGCGYPWRWSVYRWLDGVTPGVGLGDATVLAEDVAAFVLALERIDTTHAPPAGRGVPLAERDADTRTALSQLQGSVDAHAVTAVWERALAVASWRGPPVWIHGDLAPGNLLCRDGRLAGVIDFGGAGVGDPAADLLVAWTLLPSVARQRFRHALGVDDPTWRRGRGWALSIALLQLPYYRYSNPSLAASARHVVGDGAGRREGARIGVGNAPRGMGSAPGAVA